MSIAVLLSSFNGEKYIDEQIRSILNQKISLPLNLFVRDDSSTDKTLTILKAYEDKKEISVYSGENLGPAKSFMALLHNTGKNDYYAFSDQDDVWKENRLNRAIDQLRNITGPALYFSNAELVDEKLDSLGRNVYKKKPCTNLETVSCFGGLLGCTMVFNNDLAEIVKSRKSPETMIMHDCFIALLCLSIGGRIIYDEEPTVMYRQHGNNVIGVKHTVFEKVKDRIAGAFTKQSISVADQAQTVLNIYGDLVSQPNIEWLKKVSKYRTSIFTRVSLSLNPNLKSTSANLELKNRLMILFGNR